MDMQSYLTIYLIGCGLVIILLFVKIVLFWALSWMSKENILSKNLKKIQEPDNTTIFQKAGVFIGTLLLEALLSWINVLVITWQIIKMLLNVLREVLASIPEEIKLLRFPLYNNPDMPRESVWAHLSALNIKAGKVQPDVTSFTDSLNELVEYYPSFGRKFAVNELKKLNVVDEITISSLLTEKSE